MESDRTNTVTSYGTETNDDESLYFPITSSVENDSTADLSNDFDNKSAAEVYSQVDGRSSKIESQNIFSVDFSRGSSRRRTKTTRFDFEFLDNEDQRLLQQVIFIM